MIQFLEFFESLTGDISAYELVFDMYGIDTKVYNQKALADTENYLKRTSGAESYDFTTPDNTAKIILPNIYQFKSLKYSESPAEAGQYDAFLFCNENNSISKNSVVSIDFSLLNRGKEEAYKVVDMPNIEGIYNRIVFKLLLEPYKYKGI